MKAGIPCSKNCKCNHKKCKNKGNSAGNVIRKKRRVDHDFDDDDDDTDSDHSEFEFW